MDQGFVQAPKIANNINIKNNLIIIIIGNLIGNLIGNFGGKHPKKQELV
jgi:hypothetical protein